MEDGASRVGRLHDFRELQYAIFFTRDSGYRTDWITAKSSDNVSASIAKERRKTIS